MKFSIKDFCSKCGLQQTADLVAFTEETLHGKLGMELQEKEAQKD